MASSAHVDHDSPEYIKSTIKVYVIVGISLLILTGLTVEVASWDLNRQSAIYVALAIAGVKGTLVAAYFMHLIDEKKIIYATLTLTVVFFFFVVLVPLFTDGGTKGQNQPSQMIHAPAPVDPAAGGGHH